MGCSASMPLGGACAWIVDSPRSVVIGASYPTLSTNQG